MVNFSVIIPVYNDPEGLRDTLSSLLQQDYPQEDHEILVVDNNSTDNTKTVASDMADKYKHTHILTEEDIQSSYAARNTGIKNASGEFLAFIDADMTVEPSWLSKLESTFGETKADYIGCNIDLYLPEGERETILTRYNLKTGFPIKERMQNQNFAGAGCIAIRKEVVDHIGGFDQSLISGGDQEFGRRVADADYTQTYAADIIMQHPVRTSLKSSCKKRYRIGKGHEQLYNRYPERDFTRPLYHPFNFLPPNPFKIKSLVNDPSAIEYSCYYFIALMFKIVLLFGRISQKVDHD